jgi:N-methylhydantoinase B
VTADAITASIIGARFRALADDMALTLLNAARSSGIGVRRQFACAVLDAGGDVVVTDNPRYLASLGASTRSCAEAFAFDLEDDDVVLTNDPYGGAPSVHYFTVVAPVKIGSAISAYVAVQGHMGDIGGMVMGNYDPEAREVRTEGVRFTPLKIVKHGRRRRDVVDTIILNSRMPERLAGDLEAMIAAIRVGRRGLESLAGAHGSQVVLDAMRTAIEYSERRLRTALARVPAGEHLGCATLAAGGMNATVRVALSRVGSDTILDFAGSDPQLPIFLNCTRDTTRTYALLPLLGLLEDDGPWSGGLLRAVKTVIADGTVIAPRYPTPTGWSLEHPGREVAEAVRVALAAALPDDVGPGLPSRGLAFTVRRCARVGTTEEQLDMVDLATLAQPGAPAGAAVDGWGHPGPESLGQLPSVEEFEQSSPLKIRRLEYRCDSAGAGRHRGAPGVSALLTLGPDDHLYALAVDDPAGLAGGLAGGSGSVEIDGEVVAVALNRRLDGAELELRAAGGGGFGDPRERPREHVRADVLDGLVSDAAAQRLYGLVAE